MINDTVELSIVLPRPDTRSPRKHIDMHYPDETCPHCDSRNLRETRIVNNVGSEIIVADCDDCGDGVVYFVGDIVKNLKWIGPNGVDGDDIDRLSAQGLINFFTRKSKRG